MAKQTVAVGMQFDAWTVIGEAEPRPRKGDRAGQFFVFWRCECECGRADEVMQRSLLNGSSFRCLSCAAVARNHAHAQPVIKVNGVDHKQCPSCNLTLPLTEEFWPSHGVGRFRRECKTCYLTPTRIAAHRESNRRSGRKLWAENPEAAREHDRKWRRDNPEKFRSRARHYGAKRRAQKNRTDPAVLATIDDVRRLLASRTLCPLCRRKMTDGDPNHPRSKQIDHIIPLNVGGTHTLSNLRVICRTCNIKRPDDGSDVQGQIALWAVSFLELARDDTATEGGSLYSTAS